MHVLPAALQPLAAYRQFVCYKTWPDPKKPGKTIKATVHPVTGQVHNAHDPAIWLSFDEAAATGRMVGFTFTQADPFFFLDIDDALHDGQWSPTARELCARFTGCAVEVSQSGTGLHIIGTGEVPAHGCDSQALGSQFYTSNRFCALTGLHARGDAAHDATPTLRWLVAEHFPQTASARGEWQEGPVAEWRGPTDDEELVRRALKSQSTAAIFGGQATFAELWRADGDALAKHFPGDREPWNASQADMALASHLAFWTGCDAPRIERLMRASGLERGKWERDDYLPRTIAAVCTPGRSVCQDKVPAPAAVAEQAAPVAVERKPRGSLLDGGAMRELFTGCVYISQQHRVMLPGGKVVKPEAFSVEYGGYSFFMKDSTDGAGAIKDSAFLAFTQSSRYQCPIVDQPVFDPRRAPGEVFLSGRQRLVNTYADVAVERTPGDASPFYNYLALMLPDARDQQILLAWMAAVVQYPGIKFLWSPVLQGCKGSGKTLLFKVLMKAVGDEYSNIVPPKKMGGQFNTWMLNTIFTLGDEVGKFQGTEEWLDDIKTIITGDRQQVEPKGVDSYMTQVCTNIGFTTNHKRNFRVGEDERRFAMFWTAQQHKADINGPALAAFGRWLDTGGWAICAHELATLHIVEEFNPATSAKNAPWTSSMAQAVAGSSDKIDQLIEDAVQEGVPGFRGGFICMQRLEGLLETKGVRGVTRSVREDILERLGYVPHPHAGSKRDGWTNNPVKDEGKKLRLFVLQGHIAEQLASPPAVVKHYLDSQSVTADIGFGQERTA